MQIIVAILEDEAKNTCRPTRSLIQCWSSHTSSTGLCSVHNTKHKENIFFVLMKKEEKKKKKQNYSSSGFHFFKHSKPQWVALHSAFCSSFLKACSDTELQAAYRTKQQLRHVRYVRPFKTKCCLSLNSSWGADEDKRPLHFIRHTLLAPG